MDLIKFYKLDINSDFDDMPDELQFVFNPAGITVKYFECIDEQTYEKHKDLLDDILYNACRRSESGLRSVNLKFVLSYASMEKIISESTLNNAIPFIMKQIMKRCESEESPSEDTRLIIDRLLYEKYFKGRTLVEHHKESILPFSVLLKLNQPLVYMFSAYDLIAESVMKEIIKCNILDPSLRLYFKIKMLGN